jgi:hypothetical protein
LRNLAGMFVTVYFVGRTHSYLTHAGADRGFQQPSWDWIVVFLLLTFPLAILLHEGGHFAAGMALGWRFQSIVLGPIELARVARRLKLRLVTVRAYGSVSFAPSTFSQFKIQRSLFAIAGPVVSLASGLLFLELSFQTPSAWYFWIYSFSAQWALLGVMQVLPMRVGRMTSDGLKVLEAIHGGPDFDTLQATLLTYSSHATRLRLRDWPRDLMSRLLVIQAKLPTRRYHCYLAYLHFLDCGEIELAGRYLDQCMARWTLNDPPEYALEAAYFRARYRNNPDAARNWLSLETRHREPWVRLRARAAIEQASNRPEEARVLIRQALAVLAKAPFCGAHQYELDRLHELQEGRGHLSSTVACEGADGRTTAPISSHQAGSPHLQPRR